MTTILGTGSFLPEFIMTNGDFAKILDTSDEWIFSRTGIKSRHIAKTETITEIALKAARRALEDANTDAGELGLIVVACVTQDDICPTLACEIATALGITCAGFDVNAACSSFLYALKAGDAMREGKKALVIGADKLSSVTDYTDRSTCVLFGDGAGAVVLGEGDGEILKINLFTAPDTTGALHIPGVASPEKSVVRMAGNRVFEYATLVLEKNTRDILAQTNLTLDDINWFVPHQANYRIVKSAAKRLGVSMDRFYMNIETTGNTSSASVVIALDELARSGKLKRGDLIVSEAFGGGLTSAAAVIRW